MRARVLDGITNLSAELDDGLVHLRFDLLFQHDLAALEDFLNVRAQLAGLRVDNREFLFDTESKRVLFCAHGGAQLCLKNHGLSSRVARVASAFVSPGPVSIFPE